MERKYKLTFLPLFEHELNHIVDYITYILHNVVIDDVMEVRHIFYNRRDLQELLDD